MPKGKLGVEFYGVLSYANELSATSRSVIGALEKGGDLFAVVDQSADARKAFTVVELPNGTKLSLVQFYEQRTRGLRVNHYPGWILSKKPKNFTVVHVHIEDDVFIPDLELVPELSDFSARPPKRYYREKSPR